MNDAVAAPVADLTGAIPQETSVCYIVVPGTNKRTGWEITFAGPGHPKTIAQNDVLSRRNLNKAKDIEFAQVNQRKWKPEDRQTDDVRRESVEWTVGRIVDWTPVAIKQFAAEPINFSDKVAIDLLMQPYMGPYFMQMIDFLGNEASFIAASART